MEDKLHGVRWRCEKAGTLRWRIGDFSDESCKHQLYLTDSCFQRIVLTRRQELQVSGQHEKIIQFTRRSQRDVKVLPQFGSSRPAASLRDVRRHRECSASHLVRQSKSFCFRKCGRSSINAQGHRVALLPNEQFPKVLQGPSSCSKGQVRNVSPGANIYAVNLPLITYYFGLEGLPC
jgi:hypothetical protein